MWKTFPTKIMVALLLLFLLVSDFAPTLGNSSDRKIFPFYSWNTQKGDFDILDAGSLPNYENVDNRTLKKEWKARAGQDQLVSHWADPSETPFFVDLAANSYITFSNTFSLESKFGWEGICFEPNPEYLFNLASKRKCKTVANAVSAVTGSEFSFDMTKEGQGGFVGQGFDNKGKKSSNVKVSTVSLVDVLVTLHAPRVIQYFSLDVEGAEWEVLREFDFSKYIFLIITIERPSRLVHELLARHNYWWVGKLDNEGECWYVHESHSKHVHMLNKYRPYAVDRYQRTAHPYLQIPTWDATKHHGGAAAPSARFPT